MMYIRYFTILRLIAPTIHGGICIMIYINVQNPYPEYYRNESRNK